MGRVSDRYKRPARVSAVTLAVGALGVVSLVGLGALVALRMTQPDAKLGKVTIGPDPTRPPDPAPISADPAPIRREDSPPVAPAHELRLVGEFVSEDGRTTRFAENGTCTWESWRSPGSTEKARITWLPNGIAFFEANGKTFHEKFAKNPDGSYTSFVVWRNADGSFERPALAFGRTMRKSGTQANGVQSFDGRYEAKGQDLIIEIRGKDWGWGSKAYRATWASPTVVRLVHAKTAMHFRVTKSAAGLKLQELRYSVGSYSGEGKLALDLQRVR